MHVHTKRFVEAVEQLLPGWGVAAGQQADQEFWRSEFRGRRDVMAVRLPPAESVLRNGQKRAVDRPVPAVSGAVRLLAAVRVPDDGNLSLTFSAGLDGGAPWRCAVTVDEATLSQFEITDAAAPSGWRDVKLDLSSFAGKTVRLIVVLLPVDPNNERTAYLHNLHLQRE